MPSRRMTIIRRNAARHIREEAAALAFLRTHHDHVSNGEEGAYPNYIANYTKALPHNELGEVEPSAYRALLKALGTGHPEDFEKIPLGTPNGAKLTNPQLGLSFDLEGTDPQALTLPPAPRIDEPENSSEMGELYWMALLRDLNFTDYADNPLVQKACTDLSKFSRFRGAKQKRRVTPATLFRGNTRGDLIGPYLSQFLFKEIKYGSLTTSQRQNTVVSGVDYMTDYDSWLRIQNGVNTRGQDQFDPTFRYIRNLRDLADYLHFDAPYEPYLGACNILLTMNAARDLGNPYTYSNTQWGFGTFGSPHILCLVTEVVTRALKAIWFQKWFVHRRLRPEEFSGRIHNHMTGRVNYPIDEEILNSEAVEEIYKKYGTYLLPQAFPEGSPTHPAYGAGHAVIAGACVTILKAWFDESFVIPDPVIPNADGTALLPYKGDDAGALTVGGELNKLAANMAIGRNGAGIHWRTDYSASVKLGEAVAISILEEQANCYNEEYSFTLTRFDGTTITIG